MSAPHEPETPNKPGSPQQPGGPQFISPGQEQTQQGHQGPPPGVAGNPNAQPLGSQQPMGRQEGPGQPQPQAMGYNMQQGPGLPPKKSKTGLWIGLGAVAVVVIVALVLVLSGVFSGTNTANGGEGEQAKESKQSAKDIATNYLTAISEGRADDAKKMLGPTSSDTSLMTNEVLKDSLTRAPITDISVTEPTGGSSSTVNVTYKVGGEPVNEEYTVNVRGGTISTSTPHLSLYGLKGVDITVNGVTVKEGDKSYDVFPGSYVVASANKYLEIDGESTVVVTKSSSDNIPRFKLKVSQAGIDLFREKVIPEAKACLESKNLDPGCNMALNGTLRDGKTLEDGTITRTQSSENANKLENVVPEPGASVPTIISASNLGSFKVTGICTDSTRSGECELLGGFAAVKGMKFPKASLNVAEEDPKVVWEDV